jgi:pimeloyl-ACP methyl ester carboxylesterase
MKTFKFSKHKLAYRDEGSGEAIVFVHGTPSSSEEFVPLIEHFSKKYRCLALDHLGFGQSDKPEFADYSIEAHSIRFMEWLREVGAFSKFHLVVHDFGGPIALAGAIPYSNHIQSLTLMNTWAWLLENTDENLKKQKTKMQSFLVRFLYRYFNFSARVIVKMAWGKYRPLTKEHHKKYMSAFPSASTRSGTLGFLKALFDPNEPAWELESNLNVFSKTKTQIIWGKRDVISINTLDHWKKILPHAKVNVLEDVGHFICDEAPDLVIPILEQHFHS